MAGTTTISPDTEMDVVVLKEMLLSQQQLLQKLSAELDEEREAANSATTEALSMILRLQGEKAAMKMELSQYKRMAEEKMTHAEESLAVFEELVYQKEMEYSALELQIEAYQYEQQRNDPFAERNDANRREKGIKSTIRRLSSLPSLFPSDFHKTKSSGDEKKHATPMLDSSASIETAEFNSFLEQIRVLDEKVRKISDCKEIGKKKLSKIKVKRESRGTSPARAKLPPICQEKKAREDQPEKPILSSSSSFKSVHDVFEVPECSERKRSSSDGQKNKGKSYVEEDDRLKKPDLFLIGSPPADDDIDWISMDDFQSVKPGKEGYKLQDEVNPFPGPDYDSAVEYDTQWAERTNMLSSNKGKGSCKPSDDCKSTLRRPPIPTYRSELRLLAQRVEQLESRRTNECHGGRENELNLLMQLSEQLVSIQSEMRSWRPNKPTPSEEVSLLPLSEVTMHFWL